MNDEQHINFDEYIRQGEPHRQTRADAWRVAKGIDYEPVFLFRFFRNLLLGEENELRNRYMLIDPTEEWKTPSNEHMQSDHRTSTGQVTEQVQVLLLAIGDKQLSLKQMMNNLGLKHRPNFIDLYLSQLSQQATSVYSILTNPVTHGRNTCLQPRDCFY